MIKDSKGNTWVKYKEVTLIPYSQTSPPVFYDISMNEAKDLLAKTRTWMIRWYDKPSYDVKRPFWWCVCDKYDFNSLKQSARYDIKKGQKNCTVKYLADIQAVAADAYETVVQAYKRYPGFSVLPEVWRTIGSFTSHLSALSTENDRDIWGVFFGGKLVGFGICTRYDDRKEVAITVLKYHPDYIKHGSSYVMLNHINDYYLNNRKLALITNGTISLSHDTNMQQWLVDKLGYKKLYCNLKIAYALPLWILIQGVYPIRKPILFLTKLFPALKISNMVQSIIFHEQLRKGCEVS